jgi:hypothetical protein
MVLLEAKISKFPYDMISEATRIHKKNDNFRWGKPLSLGFKTSEGTLSLGFAGGYLPLQPGLGTAINRGAAVQGFIPMGRG